MEYMIDNIDYYIFLNLTEYTKVYSLSHFLNKYFIEHLQMQMLI